MAANLRHGNIKGVALRSGARTNTVQRPAETIRWRATELNEHPAKNYDDTTKAVRPVGQGLIIPWNTLRLRDEIILL